MNKSCPDELSMSVIPMSDIPQEVGSRWRGVVHRIDGDVAYATLTDPCGNEWDAELNAEKLAAGGVTEPGPFWRDVYQEGSQIIPKYSAIPWEFTEEQVRSVNEQVKEIEALVSDMLKAEQAMETQAEPSN